MQRISGEISNAGCEPEVQLAIRISPHTPSEDEDELDSFFSEHGFEFISVTESATSADSEGLGTFYAVI